MPKCEVKYLRSASGIFKILEIVSVSVAFGMFQGVPLTFGDPSDTEVDIGTSADFFAGGVMVSALLISPLFFLLYFLQLVNVQQTVLELAINFLLAVFLFISASLCMGFYHTAEGVWADKKAAGITMGIFCYIGSIAYVLDSLLACRNYCKAPKNIPAPIESTA